MVDRKRDSIDEQDSNAELPMPLRLVGREIFANFLQKEKAETPIFVIEPVSWTAVSSEQPLKVRSFISLMPDGTVILIKLRQF